MRIDWAVGCRYCEVHDSLATIVGAGADTLTAPTLPINAGLLFAVRTLFGQADIGSHRLTSIVLGPDMEPVGEPIVAEVAVAGQGDPHQQPGWEGKMIFPFAVHWPATEPGVYTITFRIDDGLAFDVPVVVQLAGDS